jgi:hypothetical protein
MSVNTCRSTRFTLARKRQKGIQGDLAHARICESDLQMALGSSQVGIIGQVGCGALCVDVIGFGRQR